MGPFEKVDNIKNLIKQPLKNETIRVKEKEKSDFENTGDPNYSYYDLGDFEEQTKID